MSVILTQIDLKIAIIKFSESYFNEGRVEDREFVRNKIVELQRILNELDEVRLMLMADDLRTSFSEKEISLKKGKLL